MKLFEIPTRRTRVKVHLASCGEVEGVLFVPESGPDGRPSTLDRRLNDEEEAFLALSTEDGGVLVHRAGIEAVYAEDARAPDEDSPGGQAVGVVVDLLGGTRLEGRIAYSMPEGRQRLIDYMNFAPRFVLLRSDPGDVWFNRDRVVRIRIID